MPNLPAFCNNCGTMIPSLLSGMDTSIGISDIKSGPCPNCGGMGTIPNGVHTIIGDTIKILVESKYSKKEFRKIASSLENLRNQNKSVDEISSQIKENLPELSSFTDVIPKTRTELYAFIALIISAITLIISFSGKREESKIEIHNVINNITEKKSKTVVINTTIQAQ